MIAYILTHLWVFMEMLFLDILADAFLIKRNREADQNVFLVCSF